MAITRVDQDLPNRNKTTLLNDMILELNGLVQNGKFDINELDQLFSLLPVFRKFKRNVAIGNTVSTYTDWSHLQAEVGYSIWKLTPTNYVHNAINKLYMNNKVFENRGLATSESSLAFTSVFLENLDSGSGFVDNTTEAGTEAGTQFALNDTKQDYLYLGDSATFGGAKFEFQTRGSNYTLVVEYFNSVTWQTLVSTTDNLEDGTSNFQGDGHITFDVPNDMSQTTINGVNQYWIRISTTTDPITVAQAYLVIPKTSVIGLLGLSTSEIQNEEWAWCSFSGSIYATIQNSGSTAAEGNKYITSSSTTANLQNFFVFNNPFTADYENSTYNPVKEITANYSILATDGIILADASSATADITLTLPAAHTRENFQFVIKRVDASPNDTVIATESGSTIDGAGTYTLDAQYKFITVVSDDANWHIIGGGAL